MTGYSRCLLILMLSVVSLASAPGCGQTIGAAAYFLQPKRVQKAEFKLTSGRLAVLVETVRPEQENPVFTREFYEQIAKVFRTQKVNTRLVSYAELYGLRQEQPEYAGWSVQRIGRELEAEQVLYVRVANLQLREDPRHPLLAPTAELRLSVIDPGSPADLARLWPKDLEVRELTIRRPPREMGSSGLLDRETAQLAREAASRVAEYFYDVDLETPRERFD